MIIDQQMTVYEDTSVPEKFSNNLIVNKEMNKSRFIMGLSPEMKTR